MFKSKGKINPNLTDTLVGEGSTFEGNIQSAASIRIDGTLNGNIRCGGDVTIGEKGQVHSNIHARNIVLAGIVNGHVTASGKLSILSTGQLYGNLQVKELIVENGAVFEGASKMDTKKPAKAEPQPEPSQATSKQNTDNTSVLKSW